MLVVKIGGASGIGQWLETLARDAKQVAVESRGLVIVHGG